MELNSIQLKLFTKQLKRYMMISFKSSLKNSTVFLIDFIFFRVYIVLLIAEVMQSVLSPG